MEGWRRPYEMGPPQLDKNMVGWGKRHTWMVLCGEGVWKVARDLKKRGTLGRKSIFRRERQGFETLKKSRRRQVQNRVPQLGLSPFPPTPLLPVGLLNLSLAGGQAEM